MVLYLCSFNKRTLRYFLKIRYNGKAYHGWQMQPNAITVQEVFEKCLSTILRQDIPIVGAGRTDAGVHAAQMYLHFDSEKEITDLDQLVYKLNSFLPKDIAVLDAYRVTDEAHARFDALTREYRYEISLKKDPFLQDFAWEIKHLQLNVDLMNQAAEILLAHTDYESFSRTHTDVKTFECEVTKAVWKQESDRLWFEVKANRFLRNMVRAMVGTLVEVGRGRCSLTEFKTILNSKDRSKAGASAPAHGLYLWEVDYPENIFL